MGEKKLMLINKGMIYFTPDTAFTLNDTTFPKESLSFHTHKSVFLEIQGRYDEETVFVEIVNFNPVDIDSFYSQSIKRKIKQIHFENLNWPKFERLLGSYKRSELVPFLDKNTIEKNPCYEDIDIDKRTESFSYSNGTITGMHSYIAYTPPPDREFAGEAEVSYSDAHFFDGYVWFKKKFTWHHEAIIFTIDNPFIKKEFESIKDYFAKAISGKKRFTIKALITLKYTGEVVKSSATSDDIDKIGPVLIDGIKKKITNKLVSVSNSKSGKAILDADEIFKQLQDVPQNIFMQTENNILNLIIEEKSIRNKKQLQYLAEKRQSTKEKLRFTLYPLFGFLFFIEGIAKNHFCWELLNSHATYLWSFDKSFDRPYNRIEETISHIQDMGRQSYRDNYKNGQIDQDLEFTVIDHKSAKSEGVDSFIEWQKKLEGILK